MKTHACLRQLVHVARKEFSILGSKDECIWPPLVDQSSENAIRKSTVPEKKAKSSCVKRQVKPNVEDKVQHFFCSSAHAEPQ